MKIGSSLFDSLSQAVTSAAQVVTEYQAKVNYRLEGIGRTFDDEYKLIRHSIGISGVIKQEEVIKKIGEAVDQGIAYNVEQRAFLSMVSENIQSTFDAFNSNLTRIIRIQQADSTIARLGMSKAINDLLTNMFKDSSYMDTVYQTVSENLFEMTSTMSREESVNTEYVIQKWLGGLYSLGASSNAISAISQGLGYLGSGNV